MDNTYMQISINLLCMYVLYKYVQDLSRIVLLSS